MRSSIHTTTQNKHWETEILDPVKVCCPTRRDTLFNVYESKPFKFDICPHFQGANVFLAFGLSGIRQEEKPDKGTPKEVC